MSLLGVGVGAGDVLRLQIAGERGIPETAKAVSVNLTATEAQGVSYSTLKSRVQAARKALRRQFDRCCALTLDGKGAVIDFTRRDNGCGPC